MDDGARRGMVAAVAYVVGSVAVAYILGSTLVTATDSGLRGWLPWESPRDGWHAVALPGRITHLEPWSLGQAYVAGHHGDRPVVSRLLPDGSVERLETAGRGRIISFSPGSGIGAIVVDDDLAAPPVGFVYEGSDDPYVGEAIPDRDGRIPDIEWLTPEDGFWGSIGGFLDPDGRLELRAMDTIFVGYSETSSLWLADGADPDELLVSGAEGFYLLGGPVSAHPGAALDTHELWVAGTADGPAFERPEVAMDRVTDVLSDSYFLTVAGIDDGRPVVADRDSLSDPTNGPPVPDVVLGDDAEVLIAEQGRPGYEDGARTYRQAPSLVLQDASGATLYLADGATWDRVRLPFDHVEAAGLSTADDGQRVLYVVVDGRVWWRALPPSADADASSPSVTGDDAPTAPSALGLRP